MPLHPADGLLLLGFFFLTKLFFNPDVVKLFGVKDLAALHTLHKLRIFGTGDDTYGGVLAGIRHAVWWDSLCGGVVCQPGMMKLAIMIIIYDQFAVATPSFDTYT